MCVPVVTLLSVTVINRSPSTQSHGTGYRKGLERVVETPPCFPWSGEGRVLKREWWSESGEVSGEVRVVKWEWWSESVEENWCLRVLKWKCWRELMAESWSQYVELRVCKRDRENVILEKRVSKPCMHLPVVVEHISERDHSAGTDAVDNHTEVTATDHHTSPAKALQRETPGDKRLKEKRL